VFIVFIIRYIFKPKKIISNKWLFIFKNIKKCLLYFDFQKINRITKKINRIINRINRIKVLESINLSLVKNLFITNA
jgi:hypothetical protein